MKKFVLLTLIILGVFLSLFLILLALGIPFNEFFAGLVTKGGFVGMLVSVALLVSDVVLPVPSSIIMIANGALYGTFTGAALSLAGGLGATLTGYLIGRGGEKRALKFLKPEELEAGRSFFLRWGMLAVIISRPVPLLSETIAVMAGISRWGVSRTLLSAIAGYLPVCLIYAYSGEFALQSDYGTKIFLLVMATGLVVWLVAKLFRKEQKAGL